MKKEKFSDMVSLILFTSLLPIAIGIQTGTAVSYFFSVSSMNHFIRPLGVALVLTIMGVVFVTVHLGKKARGIYAVKGIGHSYLSLESVVSFLFGVFLFLSFLFLWFSLPRWLVMAALTGAAVFGWMTAIVIGKVYDLRGQLTWQGRVPMLGPMVAAVSMAVSTLMMLSDHGEWSMVLKGCLMMVLGVDGLFSFRKLITFVSLRNLPFVLTYPHLRKWVIGLYVSKIVIIAVIYLLLTVSFNHPVVFLLVTIILLDRMGFYVSAAQATPESIVLSLKSERMGAALGDQ